MSSEEILSLQTACLFGDKLKVRNILYQNNCNDYLASSSGYSLLCRTLKGFSHDISTLLLQYPVKVNDETQARGQTPLHFAVECGDMKIMEILLRKGANVNAKNCDLNTPLHIAVSKYLNYTESVIQLLLDNGADLKVYNMFGFTPHHVCIKSYRRILLQHEIKMLLNDGGDIDEKDFSGYTALHRAVESENCDIVEFFLSRGSDVNAETKFGKTPLHLACQERNEEILLLLLRAGANVNATTDTGDTPLHLAAKNISLGECGEFLKKLVNYGAELTAKNNCGLFPINYAVENRSLVETTILLGERPNNWDMTLKNAFCYSFLLPYFETLNGLESSGDYGEKIKNYQLMSELFYNHGFRINTEDVKNMTIPKEFDSVTLDHSLMEEHRMIVQSLLNKEETTCYETMIQEFIEYHILIGAIKYGFIDIFYNFLPNFCNVNNCLIEDCTLLDYACEKGCPTIVKELLDRGANVNVYFCTDAEKAPLCALINQNNFKCVKLLLEAGAKVNCITYFDYVRPLYSASALKNNLLITKLLLHYGATYRPEEMNALIKCPTILSAHSEIFDLTFDHSVYTNILALIDSKFYNEIDQLKKIKVSETDVTIYDLQTMSHRRLSILMRNENFLDFINSFDFQTSFPNFARRIGVRIDKAKLEKRLIELSYECFRTIVKFQLPILVFNEIVSYIDTADLHRFIIASPIEWEMKKTVQFHYEID
ncbi:putative ankyrin repeat protein RF_0381 [Leptopilina heterotoma]|uniref:putative ankyrin repeat protein RF_0381 n=1 Tax=Leptopilina heterotoma TaxID=63436 RepID=UPI001CA88D23|nr:putative ankyrin repeat protein RF_0381 [Leptopilina heterotoma]